MFLTSTFVPNSSRPRGRTDTFTSATELSLLHVAVRHADELHDLLELGQVSNRFLGAADIGLAHDLRERNTGAVEVDIAVAIRILEAVVDGLSGVFFEVQPRDADAFRPSADVDLQPTVLGERLIELRDLVTLRQVGIEVVLARKAEKLRTSQWRANEALIPKMTAWRFKTGSAPGRPRVTGSVCVFAGLPKAVEERLKSLVFVPSCTWTSSPMTGSYVDCISHHPTAEAREKRP